MRYEIVVRPVEQSDIPELWTIVKSNSDNNEAAFVERVMEKQTQDGHYIPVAEQGGRAIGYAWVHDYGPHIRVGHRTARMNDLFVAEACRGNGAGRALVKAVIEWCERRGVRWLQWQSSAKAVSFYERLGYTGDPCPDPGHPFFEIDFNRVQDHYPRGGTVDEHFDSSS